MILAADIGGTTCKLGILSEDLTILKQWSIKTDTSNNGVNILPNIYQSFKEASVKGYSIDQVICVGLGVPGPIHFSEGSINGAVNLNWNGTKYVRDEFEKLINKPVVVDNDANVAALGEKWKGAGSDNRDVVFVTLGTGVGGGIIANGDLIHGTADSGGEIGHITIDPGGFECTCGKRGCLETVASATGIINLARKYSEEFSGESKLKNMIDDGRQVTAKDVFDMAKEGDEFAEIVVDQFAYFLGLACSHIGNMLNPKFIIIGGGVSNAGEFLIEQVRTYFKENAFFNVRQTTQIRVAELGNDAGVIGAAYLVKSI